MVSDGGEVQRSHPDGRRMSLSAEQAFTEWIALLSLIELSALVREADLADKCIGALADCSCTTRYPR